MHTYRPLGWTRKGRAILPVAGGNGTGDSGGSGAAGSSGDGAVGDGSDSGSGSGSRSTSGDAGASGTSGGGATGDKGYPEGTPVADMTTDQQAAYWKHHARQWEDRAKARGDYDDLKAKAAKLDEIEAANATEAEKAAKAAREEGKAEGLREAGGKMVDAHISAAVTAGRLTEAQADVVLDGLDRTRFLTSEGTVDTDKVQTFLDSIAPAKGNGSGFPDLGQGRRHGGTKVSGKEQGREEARRRFGDRAGAAK